MNSVIESARQSHEEIDLYEQALAAIFLQTDDSHKHKLEKEHRASDVLNRIVQRKATLKEHYADPTGSRAEEIALLSAPAPPADDLEEFYARLVSIKEFHRKNPDVDSRAVESEIRTLVEGPDYSNEDELAVDPISSLFSGEESLGRFLDVYLYHSQYINLKGVDRIPYLAYLDLLSKGTPDAKLARKEKGSPAYLEYIQALHAYLLSFLSRTKPLKDITALKVQAEKEFEEAWAAGTLAGWEEEKEDGAEGEKKEGDGIWCPACQKMYSKQTVYDAHLKSKKHEKATARLTATASASTDPSSSASADPSSTSAPSTLSLTALRHAKLRPAALATYLTRSLLLSSNFRPLLADTRSNVERRSALTARERELELEEPAPELALTVEEGGAEEDEDDEEKLYNPLKLPMGWDGKPIPFWLYKLHGLGVEYKCEICSDFAYMGRKNFERHFQESRHAFGMKALGLPNTKHFHEITKIEDALALAERLKQDAKQDSRSTEAMEELEDSEGNVYDKKTYEDLQRQGLLS